jgi:hypothetical protein
VLRRPAPWIASLSPVRGRERRTGAEQNSAERDRRHEREHAPVNAGAGRPGGSSTAVEIINEATANSAEQHAATREHGALASNADNAALPVEPCVARSRAVRAARAQQVRGVGAGDQQQYRDGAEQQAQAVGGTGEAAA